jgi:hypothetical protein
LYPNAPSSQESYQVHCKPAEKKYHQPAQAIQGQRQLQAIVPQGLGTGLREKQELC